MAAADAATFEGFRALLADLLDVDEERVTAHAYFVTDLGVDSLRMLQLLLRLQGEGFLLAPEDAWRIQTVADAWEYWQARGQDSTGQTPPGGGSHDPA
jgi:acyl carrier protein